MFSRFRSRVGSFDFLRQVRTMSAFVRLLLIAFAAASLFSDAKVQAAKRQFQFSTGVALEFGRWELEAHGDGRLKIVHDFHGKRRHWNSIALMEHENRRLWKRIQLAELANQENSKRPGVPGEVHFQYAITDGKRTTRRRQWGQDAVAVPGLGSLTRYLGELLAKYTGSSRVWFGPSGQDSTETRLKVLHQDIESFRLSLSYIGPEDKPFYRLHLQVAPLPPIKTSPFHRHVQISKKEARELVKGLANAGILMDGRGGEAKIDGGPAYLLRMSNGRYTMYESLGFGLFMRDRVKTLRTFLTGSAGEQMDRLLGRLGISADEVASHAVDGQPEKAVWGRPVDGVRVGLSPGRVTLDKQDRRAILTVWYENVGTEPRKVVDHQNLNVTTVMFVGDADGTPFRTDFAVSRLATTPLKFRELQPGERFTEQVALSPGGMTQYSGVPDLKPGNSLSIRVGWCQKSDPLTDEDWNAPTTRKSGSIVIDRTDTLSDLTVAELIRRLSSRDGHDRVTATRKLFARGDSIAGELRDAGAKQLVNESPHADRPQSDNGT